MFLFMLWTGYNGGLGDDRGMTPTTMHCISQESHRVGSPAGVQTWHARDSGDDSSPATAPAALAGQEPGSPPSTSVANHMPRSRSAGVLPVSPSLRVVVARGAPSARGISLRAMPLPPAPPSIPKRMTSKDTLWCGKASTSRQRLYCFAASKTVLNESHEREAAARRGRSFRPIS